VSEPRHPSSHGQFEPPGGSHATDSSDAHNVVSSGLSVTTPGPGNPDELFTAALFVGGTQNSALSSAVNIVGRAVDLDRIAEAVALPE
jgi:hypothetical protein